MNLNPFSLIGKTILITGAASGIGRTTAIECSKLGARLLITDINESGLSETLTMLDGKDMNHRLVLSNLTDSASLSDLASFVFDEGGIDGFVNNAGIGVTIPISFFNEDNLEKVLSINTKAPVLLTQKLLKKKAIHKGASIVFTSSIAGIHTFNPGNGIYCLSKSAINSFMKTAAMELGVKGIRCNTVNPGMVATPLLKKNLFSQEDVKKDLIKYPLGRYGETQDIAYGIIYLLSDASSWVTGTNLIIDGGRSIN